MLLLPAKIGAEVVAGAMLTTGFALAAATETIPGGDSGNLITIVVAFLSAGGIGGLVARGMLNNWQKERDTERAREDEDRAADRAVLDRLLARLEGENDYLRSRLDHLVERQYVAKQTVEQQVVERKT
jgi:hypothetical protein